MFLRLWSIHPKYLDTKGLVALWREGLLAKAVLEGKTKGYKNHPQLERFKSQKDPIKAINSYLHEILLEAKKRGYSFDETKAKKFDVEKIRVTKGQLIFEHKHIIKKLKNRAVEKHGEVSKLKKLDSHPLMKIVNGLVEDWEKINEEL
ncbi:MAG: pyrimidine dimer DNA glycosylase/endonuclease V [archaeon]